MSRPRVLIAEEGVKSFSGHFSPYSAAIAEGIQALGGEVVVAGHVDADPAVREAMPFSPVFRFSRWDGLYEHRSWLERKFLVLVHNWRLYRDMCRYLDQQDEPFDLVFCGNLLVYHSLAWMWLAKRFRGRKFSRLVVMMIQPAGAKDENTGHYHFPRRASLFAWSLRKLHEAGKGKVAFATETPAAREEFSQLTGKPISELHHPVELPKGWMVREKNDHESGKDVRIVCPGFARYEKGSDLLLGAIRRLVETSVVSDSKFVLQWKAGSGFDLPNGSRVERDEALADSGVITYYEKPLSGHDYWDFLAAGDLLVLPYRGDPYTTRLSRVTIEGMLVGLPIVYPKNSWLESAVEKHGAGVGFEDGSEESLVEAIKKALDHLESLQSEAQNKQESARKYYSAKHFAMKLSEMAGDVLESSTEGSRFVSNETKTDKKS